MGPGDHLLQTARVCSPSRFSRVALGCPAVQLGAEGARQRDVLRTAGSRPPGQPRPWRGTDGKHRPRTAGQEHWGCGKSARASGHGRRGQCREKVQGHRGEPRASGENQGRNYRIRAARACNRDDVIKLQPRSHLQSHPRSHCPLSKPLSPLTHTHNHEPLLGPGKGSGERRGATHRKPGGFRSRHVFLRHTCRAGSLPCEGVSLREGFTAASAGGWPPRGILFRSPGDGPRAMLGPCSRSLAHRHGSR